MYHVRERNEKTTDEHEPIGRLSCSLFAQKSSAESCPVRAVVIVVPRRVGFAGPVSRGLEGGAMRAGSGAATGVGVGVGSGGGVGAAIGSGTGTGMGVTDGGEGGAIEGTVGGDADGIGIVVNSGGLARIQNKRPPAAPAPKQLRSVNTPKQPAATFAFDIESLLQARAEVVGAG